MRTNWASGDKVTAADFNEISTMLASHDTTVDAHDGALSSQANAISVAATAAQEAKDAAAAAATAAQEAKDAAPSTTTTYTGTVWPLRPSTTASVVWVDPTGTATMPSGMVAGDVLLAADPTATTSRDLLLPAEQRFGLPWTATGAASITPGTSAAITASGGKLSMSGIAVTPGQQLTYSATSTQPVTLSWETWGGGGQSGSGWTTGASLPITVPAGSTELVLRIEYASDAATLSGVSVAVV